MRVFILVLVALLGASCAGRQSDAERPEPVSKFGVITAREAVEMETVERHSRTSPSFHASISSGGGVAIGLGFLMSPFRSSETVENPIRYEVLTQDGETVTIYHLSSMFQVNDCVMITAYPDEESNPPEMVRSEVGCEQ